MSEQLDVTPEAGDESGLTPAVRAAREMLDHLLELALRRARADRVALFIFEGGSLTCRALRGRAAIEALATVAADDTVQAALAAPRPVTVASHARLRLVPTWCRALGARSVMLTSLRTPEGSMGLLALGWDGRRARRSARLSAATAATALAGVIAA